MKQHYFLACLFAVVLTANAQIVNIPDANFKNALVNTLCVAEYSWETPTDDVDTNNDGEIQVSEAAVVDCLKVSNQNIVSLSGIESFTNLMFLICDNNQLTTLTVSNPWLVELDCSHNQLTSLIADFWNSMIYEITLDCSYNALTTLTLSNDYFYIANCDFNQISEFIVPGSVQYLTLAGNSFTTFDSATMGGYVVGLDLSQCPFLTSAIVKTESAAINDNPLLTSLVVGSNGDYNIQNNPVLQSISLKDGHYGFIDGDFPDPHYTITNNPMLDFVCMDDLGEWYYEGEWFYQDEMDHFTLLDPAVNKTFYCDLTPGGGYNTINGTIHYECASVNTPINIDGVEINLDQNNNGSIQASVSPNNTGGFVFYASGSGTIAPSFTNNYFTVSPANAAFSFLDDGETQNVNFCISPNGTHPDLKVSIIPIVPARPGFDAVYKIVYSNQGTQVQSGSVNLSFEDDRIDFVSANPAVNVQNIGALSWDFVTLSPFETREIILTLNVNSPVETPAVNIGDTLNLSATLSGSDTDETPADNTNALVQIVVGSFDPNDKAVSRPTIGIGQLDEYLYYTVRFQNTGTYFAENVVIRDILSKNLDTATFEVVSTSHNCHSLLTRATNSNSPDKLEFFFEGINLPAVINDEPGSHGLVTYKIKPKNNLVVNDVISNKAEIYFDYNSAIVTNTVTTTVTALGVDQTDAIHFALYPNPTKQLLTIALDNNVVVEKICIYNTLGQTVKNIPPTFENASMTTDISSLNQGTYFVRIVSDKGTATRKLIKL